MVATSSFIVSLHDAHPGSQTAIQEQIDFLASHGIERTSILVVPEFHHRYPVAEDEGFCAAVSRWQAQGHEIVLHGCYHDRLESPPENLQTLFWTRLYTNQEAEFLDLPLVTARSRLERSRALFQKWGWDVRGFIAPAWLMAPGLIKLLTELGFAYTNTRREIVPLLPGINRIVFSPSLCYSTRTTWRRIASGIWNKQLYGRLRGTELIRLSLHPLDFSYPLMRRQVEQIVRATLKLGFVPTTYGGYVAR